MDIEFPVTSTPGEHVQEGRGRLVNVFAEPVIDDRQQHRQKGQEKAVWRRVAGTTQWGNSGSSEPFRGMFHVEGTLYAVWGDNIFTFNSSGGAGSGGFTGVPGTVRPIWARNNASPPHIVMVVPGDGARAVASSGAISAYPDADLPFANSVCFLQGFFIFSVENGRMYASGINDTTIEALNFATAETKPDNLLRVIPLGVGQLLACSDQSIEVWGPPINAEGFPFSYITTIPYGLISRYAIAGHEDGFTSGIFFVAHDHCVYFMNGYKPVKVSTTDLERRIRQLASHDDLEISVYNFSGRGTVVVQSPLWSWHFDCTTLKWHERESYLQPTWRHRYPIWAFNKWLVGDTMSGALAAIDPDVEREMTNPLPAMLEGVVDTFPAKARCSRIDINYTRGVGRTTGAVPIETDPQLMISYSIDGGVHYSDPIHRPLGQMGQPVGQATVRNCGIAKQMGYRVRLAVTDPVYFGILGGELTPAGAV